MWVWELEESNQKALSSWRNEISPINKKNTSQSVHTHAHTQVKIVHNSFSRDPITMTVLPSFYWFPQTMAHLEAGIYIISSSSQT